MIVLTLEQILELHALGIESTGGGGGLHDLGRLEAAIAAQTQNVFGEELYPKIVDKAAALIRGLIADHAFMGCNKRTAMLAGLTILSLNKLKFKAKLGEIESFAVDIAVNHLDVPEVASWLQDHLK